MSTPNRSIEVRRQARANLLKMRQARLNKRSGILTQTVAVGTTDLVEAELETALAYADDALDELAPTEAMKASSAKSDGSAPAEAEPVAHAEAPKDGSGIMPVPEAAPQTPPEGAVLDSPLDIAEFDTDLSSIPGAGPGLIWMLWNASVRSLDDLASADSENLKSALGPVGVILDVEALIAFARTSASATE